MGLALLVALPPIDAYPQEGGRANAVEPIGAFSSGAQGAAVGTPERNTPSGTNDPFGSAPFVRGLSGHFSGPHPASFYPFGRPPGAPVPIGSPLRSLRAGGALSQTPTAWNNSYCAGLWPDAPNDSSAQEYYDGGCYGHDEPGIQFYSDLPGSGGNVTWNVRLPVDRSPTQLQGDLYTAIWFGLTLTDPYSWLHQCFLELQFYPDQDWFSGTAPGNWIGAAVAWQIEASNGYENPCFYQPLYLDGTSGGTFFDMSQGDAISVTMTGWAGDPTGEKLAITDATSDSTSTLFLFNTTANLPLDPAYPSNSFQNSLQWTPGGEFPVVFAFETGHANSGSVPSNNSYGGCSPGPPPPTSTDRAVPCPSYDPGSWANDSLAPWRIAPPVFFNATTRSVPVQVGFGQDFGGFRLIDDLSNGACTGREGSSWCSYPWYSYNCAAGAFEFGSTDYPGASEDFGKYREYGSVAQQNGLGLGFYPPTNATVPSCGGPAYSVSVGATSGGLVHLLGRSFPPNGTLSNLSAGNYSASATPSSGFAFIGWKSTGLVQITSGPLDPWANLAVLGNGTLEAQFGPNPKLTTINVSVEGGVGRAGTIGVVVNNAIYDGGQALAQLADLSTFSLPPGIYGIEAYPPPGGTFGAWRGGPGLEIAAPGLPYTWLVVTGGTAFTSLNASFETSQGRSSVTFVVTGSGGGLVRFNGT
ncbi:MAG TPA: hypothetical protein VGV64_03015, partial [Thermoplasmata archaeon]|nr:hypothetical protein [Thermoplasmata archaeon]